MKRIRFSTSLIIAIGLLLPLLSNAQFSVKKVTGPTAVNTAQDGFYYALPQTVLKIDFVVEKIRSLRGPLGDYSEEYLGTNDIVQINGTSYSVMNVSVQALAEPDPNQLYYVQFPAEKSKEEQSVAFQLTANGTLKAFDNEVVGEEVKTQPVDQTLIFMKGDEDFHYYADYHRQKKIDTIRRKITIDTVSVERFIFKTSWIDKSAEDKANEAALNIANIREARFNLISGYQEVNYGESIRYMDQQLQELENKYLELFLGKEFKTYENQTVYYIPAKGNNGGQLIGFDGGKNVSISIKSQGTSANLPEKALEKPDQVYYVFPDIATVELNFDGEIIYRENMSISQLGTVVGAPLGRAKTQFDPKTGSMTKIIRQ